MKETVNFGFKKPESTDFVDVSVFGENFDKIDAELARKTIPIVLNQEIDLRQDINSIDVTDQIAAVADRFVADLKRGIPVSVTFTTENTPVTVLLKDWFETNPEMYTVSGICPNFHDITAISQFNLSVNLGYHSELQYTANVGGGSGLPADFPVSVDENGYTQIEGLPRATNIDNVLDGDVLTVTSTLQDDRTIPGTMTFDANGMPESYTEEGLACKFSFTGFEKPKTVELPVVELTTMIPIVDSSGGGIEASFSDAENDALNNAVGLPCVIKCSVSGTLVTGVFTYLPTDTVQSYMLTFSSLVVNIHKDAEAWEAYAVLA